jgi:hypothetical protein
MNIIVRLLCLTAFMMITMVKLIPLIKNWNELDKVDRILHIVFVVCPLILFFVLLVDWIIPFVK